MELEKAQFIRGKQNNGDMELSELKRLRQLEDENTHLKKMYATLSRDHELLKEVLEKSTTWI